MITFGIPCLEGIRFGTKKKAVKMMDEGIDFGLKTNLYSCCDWGVI